MKKFVQPGEILTFVAPMGGVVGGNAYQFESLLAVALDDADADEEFEGRVTGVVELAKATGAAWTQGQALYWNADDEEVTDEAGENLLIGSAARDEESAAATGRVRLNGAAVALGDETVATADLADGAVTFAKTAMFVSTEQTATGSSQNVAHGLGTTPSAVFISVTELPDAIVAGGDGFDIAEGSHDATNVVVTVTATVKFKVMAWA